jgi:ABC-type dipeptide/oligopeptide/nickel transport system permease subunit
LTRGSGPTAADGTGLSPTRAALRRLARDRVAVACVVVLAGFGLVALCAPLLTRLEGQSYAALHTELVDAYGYPVVGPGSRHWFGIEPRLGRDLFARWAYGARPSLLIGVAAASGAALLGVPLGLVAGFVGGVVDRVIVWVIDFTLSIPAILFVVAAVPVVATWFGPATSRSSTLDAQIRLWTLVCVFALFGWPVMARLIRGEVLSLRERNFVDAARLLGMRTRRILRSELLPNLTGPMVVGVSLAIPAYVTAEAGLSFLGVGLIEPTASWGRTIADATAYYASDPLYLWVPAASVLLLVLALNLLGDAIRDAFDPTAR